MCKRANSLIVQKSVNSTQEMQKTIQKEDYRRVIYDKGCLRSGEEWVERNLVPVAGVAVAISVLQVRL